MKSQSLLKKVRRHFFRSVKSSCYPVTYLYRHMEEIEKWARRLLKEFPKANRRIVLCAVWLHDIGQTFGSRGRDHAVKSEKEVRHFLKSVGASPETIDRVAHCVRAHRCKDVQPLTIEAKILAAADSASHFTDTVYFDISALTSKQAALKKLERDYRDVNLLPGLRRAVKPLYEAWRTILSAYTD